MPKDPTRLDLTGSYAAYLELRSQIDLTPAESTEIFSRFRTEIENNQASQRFATRYRRSKMGHFCVGALEQTEPRGLAHDFRLEYYAGLAERTYRALTLPGKVPSVLDMLQMLSGVPEEQFFMCRLTFEYPKAQYLSNVGLPMTMAENANLPFTEISGIHFTASEENLPVYDVIVEHGLPDDDSVSHILSFAYVAEFRVDLPHSVLEEGSKISLRFGGSQ